MPGDAGVTVTACVRATLSFARKAAGASGARHSLRPLIFRWRNCFAKLGRIVPRECGAALSRLPRPVLTGRGRGEGLYPRTKLADRAPHPPGFAALRRATSPREERGEVTRDASRGSR